MYSTITFTKEGLEHVEEIVELAFHHIGAIKAAGVLECLHKEMADLSEMHFRYADKSDHLRGGLAVILQGKPLKDVLSKDKFFEQFKPELIWVR
ncbi:hypothetical protein L596_022031 [Steinernema carpocapsae]|uniref:Uncharacterized protein n=1 Tax=Steinernema carpocapsae TaxID=34508 RepID=A0A4U5MKJ6_STECR|nr:hypothetical protein L596_022031 [Steinernema carpocapsae]